MRHVLMRHVKSDLTLRPSEPLEQGHGSQYTTEGQIFINIQFDEFHSYHLYCIYVHAIGNVGMRANYEIYTTSILYLFIIPIFTQCMRLSRVRCQEGWTPETRLFIFLYWFSFVNINMQFAWGIQFLMWGCRKWTKISEPLSVNKMSLFWWLKFQRFNKIMLAK